MLAALEKEKKCRTSTKIIRFKFHVDHRHSTWRGSVKLHITIVKLFDYYDQPQSPMTIVKVTLIDPNYTKHL